MLISHKTKKIIMKNVQTIYYHQKTATYEMVFNLHAASYIQNDNAGN